MAIDFRLNWQTVVRLWLTRGLREGDACFNTSCPAIGCTAKFCLGSGLDDEVVSGSICF